MGETIQFRPRRTYLQAAREQGVYQEREELRDENACWKAGRPYEGQSRPSVDAGKPLTPISKDAAEFQAGVAAGEKRAEHRFRQLADAFDVTALAGPWFPFFVAVAIETDVEPERATAIFDGVANDFKRHRIPVADNTNFGA